MLTLALYFPASLAMNLLQDSIGSDFSDLGQKLLGGFAAAVAVAVVYTVIKIRLRDKNPPTAFISVTNCTKEDAPTRPPGD